MKTSYDIVKNLLRSEKGTKLESYRKYIFQVAYSAGKIDIKKAVEEIYKVNVQDVNTTINPGKSRMVRREIGYKPDWKKAIVTLKEGQKIEIK